MGSGRRGVCTRKLGVRMAALFVRPQGGAFAEERLARAHEQIDELTDELERVRDITFKQWKAGRKREEP